MANPHIALAFSGLAILSLAVSQPAQQRASEVAVMEIKIGDFFPWRLSAQLGSGRRWFLRESPGCCVRLIREEMEPSTHPLDGSEQLQAFYFKAYQSGVVELVFDYRREFIPTEPAAKTAVLRVTVR
jgi:Chagasin family peptidase inhibitor I42